MDRNWCARATRRPTTELSDATRPSLLYLLLLWSSFELGLVVAGTGAGASAGAGSSVEWAEEGPTTTEEEDPF